VQPLPPEIEAVAYRSLQEMLTNALRHGTAGYPVSVRQEWGDDVLIEVRNRAASAPSAASGGAGIPSMESRLASIGGELDVHLDGDDFIATARLPIRAAHA
jgi:signal transduction histidine kinase